MKRALFAVAAILVTLAAVSPASAQAVVREQTCTEVVGSNSMTYDCSFNVKDYTVGTPVTLTINYSCTGGCGPVVSFGLRGPGFAPPGTTGHMVSGKRIPNGVELTFVFDSLKNDHVGNAFFNLNLNMDDGAGNWAAHPCQVKAHLMD
ncbi:MAG TPA: hypothetical protein VGV60_17090 [Candidatus Polarisedimenticolia bacterium]|nr:hypothetical protein [Candidatus Polarisedimenticolia bacterium]